MGIGGYDSVGDAFDGGGPGKSGDKFEGGGAISDIGNAMGGPSAFGGGDNGGGGGRSNGFGLKPDGLATVDRTVDLGKFRPVARGETPTWGHYNNDNDPVSGDRYRTVQRTVNADDKEFYEKYPNSNITPEQFERQQLMSRGLSLLMSPIVGLAGNTISRMQRKGMLPGVNNDGNFGGGANATTTPKNTKDGKAGDPKIDRAVNQILNKNNLTDEQKQKEIMQTVGNLVAEKEKKAQFDSAKGTVDKAMTSAYGNYGKRFQGRIHDPLGGMGEDMDLMDQLDLLDPNAKGTNMADAAKMPSDAFNYDPAQAEAELMESVTPGEAATVDAATSYDQIASEGQMDAAQGEVSDEAQMDAEQVDMEGIATGVNEDGTINRTGEALSEYAHLGLGNVIDTSTFAGKQLAQSLGEGNYVDSKATVQGQMDILSKQFVDSQGNPTIPSWAAGTARNVARIAAFKGMSGSAATGAMAQAIMEASIPMAQADAQFFQTATLKNLDNKQQSTINRASVLAKMEVANLDARMQAAVQNSQAFLQMDLANLDNEQQARVVNAQARIQSILEDAKSENTARLFNAEQQNDFTKFYDQLNTSIAQFNASAVNEMNRFNAGEINSAAQFNAELENSRDQFYRTMQYNIDRSNVEWRRSVAETNTQMKFEGAKFDIENQLEISSEALTRLWDTMDSEFDYIMQSVTGEKDRALELYRIDRNYELGKQTNKNESRKIENEEDIARGQGLWELTTRGAGAVASFMDGGGIGGALKSFAGIF